MTQPAQAVIPRDTLLEGGRVNRPPLRRWAGELLAKLAAAPRTQAAGWLDIAGCMNNAALIEVYRGDRRGARELCELQLRWIGNLARVYGMTEVGDLAPQPWVNIGRLLRIEGDREGSLRHFALLLDAREGRGLALGPLAIDAATWQQLADTESMRAFLESLYIIDSTKTYLAAKDFQGALDFIQQARAITGEPRAISLDEAEVIALGALERYHDAMAVTERASWMQDRYAKLVRVTYRAALMVAAGATEPARALVAQIAERVLSANLDNVQDVKILRYLIQLGGMARHLGMDELAGRTWHLGLRASRKLVDVPLELTLLEALLALEGIADREALAEQRSALLRECLYTHLLAARGLSADPAAAADPVFETLRQALARVAESPLAEPQPQPVPATSSAAAGAS